MFLSLHHFILHLCQIVFIAKFTHLAHEAKSDLPHVLMSSAADIKASVTPVFECVFRQLRVLSVSSALQAKLNLTGGLSLS